MRDRGPHSIIDIRLFEKIFVASAARWDYPPAQGIVHDRAAIQQPHEGLDPCSVQDAKEATRLPPELPPVTRPTLSFQLELVQSFPVMPLVRPRRNCAAVPRKAAIPGKTVGTFFEAVRAARFFGAALTNEGG